MTFTQLQIHHFGVTLPKIWSSHQLSMNWSPSSWAGIHPDFFLWSGPCVYFMVGCPALEVRSAKIAWNSIPEGASMSGIFRNIEYISKRYQEVLRTDLGRRFLLQPRGCGSQSPSQEFLACNRAIILSLFLAFVVFIRSKAGIANLWCQGTYPITLVLF